MLANNSWYTLGDGVRLAYLAALGNLDSLCVALTTVLGAAHSLGAALLDHLAYAVGANFGLALRNHLASGVVHSSCSWLASHSTANGVSQSLCTWLASHLASRVVDNFASLLAVVATAYAVVDSLGSALRNHLADGVVANLAAALAYHSASGVVHNLRAALRNLLANGVRNLTCTALAAVLCASHFFLLTSRNPDLLADGLWWALNANSLASTWAVCTLAVACVVAPSTWLANCLLHHATRNCLSLCSPVTTFDCDHSCGRFRDDNAVTLSANFLLLNGVVNRVVHCALLGLTNWLHDTVVDRTATSFVHRLVDCVVDRLGTVLVLRRANGVVDCLRVCLVNRLLHGVVDRLGACLVLRLTNGVVDRSRVSLVDRLIDGVVDCLCACFVRRYVDAVLNFAGSRVRNHAARLDLLIHVVSFVACTSASLLDLLVNSFANGSHDSVSATCNRCTCDSAATISSSASATAFIADCATISSASSAGSSSDRTDRYRSE